MRKVISLILIFSFFFQQAGFAQVLELPVMAQDRVAASGDNFRPLHLRSVSFAPRGLLDVILDKGDEPGGKPTDRPLAPLIGYFFTGLALPDDKFWVNLRPDSDDIIDPALEGTAMGRVMLEADVQLKKDLAAATSPATPDGRKYWERLYRKAAELYGAQTEVSIPTLARPWIVPDEVILKQGREGVYIYKARLKVMLESDYLKGRDAYRFTDERQKELNEYASGLIKESIIPRLSREVNLSRRYAPLRQVFYSLILAQWIKRAFAGSPQLKELVSSIIVPKEQGWSKRAYYEAYRRSFREGEYNIREQEATGSTAVIRTYSSGGIVATDLVGDARVQYDGGGLEDLGSVRGMERLSVSPRSSGRDVVSVTGSVVRAKGKNPDLMERLVAGLFARIDRLFLGKPDPSATLGSKNIFECNDAVKADMGLVRQGVKIERLNLTCYLTVRWRWKFWETPLSRISSLFQPALSRPLLDEIAERAQKTPHLVIVDWGCGAGTALITLALELRARGITNVTFYGFSDVYYDNWKSDEAVRSGVRFIFDDAENFGEYFSEAGTKFKGDSPDVIYSHFGLYHYSDKFYYDEEHKADKGNYATYVRRLGGMLRSGGMILDAPVERTVAETGQDVVKAVGSDILEVRKDPSTGLPGFAWKTEDYSITILGRTSYPWNAKGHMVLRLDKPAAAGPGKLQADGGFSEPMELGKVIFYVQNHLDQYQKVFDAGKDVREAIENGQAERLDTHTSYQAGYESQAGVELIANGIDATLVTLGVRPTGRFGIGAFQSLGLLKEGDYAMWTTSTDGVTGAEIKITIKGGAYYLQTRTRNISAGTEAVRKGTTVQIVSGRFGDQRTRSEFSEYIRRKFEFNNRMPVILNGQAVNPMAGAHYINGDSLPGHLYKDSSIEVTISEKGLTVIDPGCGMSVEKLMTKLLIPRESDKTPPKESLTGEDIAASTKLFYRTDRALVPGQRARTVVSVQVAGVEIERIDAVGYNLPELLVIELPPDTKLTSERGSVQLDEITRASIVAAVKKIIAQGNGDKVRLLNGIGLLLKEWQRAEEGAEKPVGDGERRAGGRASQLVQEVQNEVRGWVNEQQGMGKAVLPAALTASREDLENEGPNYREDGFFEIDSSKDIIYLDDILYPFAPSRSGLFTRGDILGSDSGHEVWVADFAPGSTRVVFSHKNSVIIDRRYYELYKDNPALLVLLINHNTDYMPQEVKEQLKQKVFFRKPAKAAAAAVAEVPAKKDREAERRELERIGKVIDSFAPSFRLHREQEEAFRMELYKYLYCFPDEEKNIVTACDRISHLIGAGVIDGETGSRMVLDFFASKDPAWCILFSYPGTAYAAIAKELFRQGNSSAATWFMWKAEAWVVQMLEKDTADYALEEAMAKVFMEVGKMHRDLGEDKQAERFFSRAIGLAALAVSNSAGLNSTLLLQIAETLTDLGRKELAQRCFELSDLQLQSLNRKETRLKSLLLHSFQEGGRYAFAKASARANGLIKARTDPGDPAMKAALSKLTEEGRGLIAGDQRFTVFIAYRETSELLLSLGRTEEAMALLGDLPDEEKDSQITRVISDLLEKDQITAHDAVGLMRGITSDLYKTLAYGSIVKKLSENGDIKSILELIEPLNPSWMRPLDLDKAIAGSAREDLGRFVKLVNEAAAGEERIRLLLCLSSRYREQGERFMSESLLAQAEKESETLEARERPLVFARLAVHLAGLQRDSEARRYLEMALAALGTEGRPDRMTIQFVLQAKRIDWAMEMVKEVSPRERALAFARIAVALKNEAREAEAAEFARQAFAEAVKHENTSFVRFLADDAVQEILTSDFYYSISGRLKEYSKGNQYDYTHINKLIDTFGKRGRFDLVRDLSLLLPYSKGLGEEEVRDFLVPWETGGKKTVAEQVPERAAVEIGRFIDENSEFFSRQPHLRDLMLRRFCLLHDMLGGVPVRQLLPLLLFADEDLLAVLDGDSAVQLSLLGQGYSLDDIGIFTSLLNNLAGCFKEDPQALVRIASRWSTLYPQIKGKYSLLEDLLELSKEHPSFFKGADTARPFGPSSATGMLVKYLVSGDSGIRDERSEIDEDIAGSAPGDSLSGLPLARVNEVYKADPGAVESSPSIAAYKAARTRTAGSAASLASIVKRIAGTIMGEDSSEELYLRELIQNARDAIRSSGIRGTVKVRSFTRDGAGGKRQWIVSFEDPVGMKLGTLLGPLLVLDRSTKVGDERLSGMFGIGFYTVFANLHQGDTVRIETSTGDGVIYFAEIIKNGDDELVINRLEERAGDYQGTRIERIRSFEGEVPLLDVIFNAESLQRYCGAVRDIEITFNGKKINEDLKEMGRVNTSFGDLVVFSSSSRKQRVCKDDLFVEAPRPTVYFTLVPEMFLTFLFKAGFVIELPDGVMLTSSRKEFVDKEKTLPEVRKAVAVAVLKYVVSNFVFGNVYPIGLTQDYLQEEKVQVSPQAEQDAKLINAGKFSEADFAAYVHSPGDTEDARKQKNLLVAQLLTLIEIPDGKGGVTSLDAIRRDIVAGKKSAVKTDSVAFNSYQNKAVELRQRRVDYKALSPDEIAANGSYSAFYRLASASLRRLGLPSEVTVSLGRGGDKGIPEFFRPLTKEICFNLDVPSTERLVNDCLMARDNAADPYDFFLRFLDDLSHEGSHYYSLEHTRESNNEGSFAYYQKGLLRNFALQGTSLSDLLSDSLKGIPGEAVSGQVLQQSGEVTPAGKDGGREKVQKEIFAPLLAQNLEAQGMGTRLTFAGTAEGLLSVSPESYNIQMLDWLAEKFTRGEMSAVETAFILAHELAHIKLGHLERMTGAGAEFAANSAAIDLMTAAGYGREEAIRAGMSVIAKLTGWRQEAKAAGKIVVDEALDREHQETHPYEEMSEALGKLLDGGLVFAGADDFFKAVDRRDIRDAGAVIARVRQAQERIDGLRRSGVIKGNLASIRGKVIPIGDIHGDAAGLERYLRDSRFFERKAAGEDVKLLFLGDFVDRDRPENQLRALEIVTLLLQSCAPGDVILLAGNHEHNGVFNKELVKKGYFKYEIPEYYGTEAGAKVIAAYQALFNDLPFACLVNDEGFAVHGGIPKGGSVTLEQIRDADNDTKRGFELLRALVWNDPDILATESRGDGPFTEKDIDNFLAMNRNSKGEKLRYVIRGHQPVRGGLVSFFNGKLINVFCNTVYYGKDVGPQVAVCELREGAEPLADGGGILKDDALAAGKGIYATTLGRDKIDGIKDGAMIIEVGGRVETINMRYSGLDYSSSLAEVDRNFAQLSPEGKAKEIASAAREWAKVPENKGKPFRFLDLMCGDGTTIGQIYDELKKTGVFDEVAVEMYGLANTYCAKWKELSDTKGIRFILASAADVGLFFKENVNFVLSHKGLHLIETRDYSMLTRISAVLVEGGALYVMPVPFWGQYPDAAGRMSDWLGAVYSVEGKGLAAKLRKTASADHAGQADGGTKGGVDFRSVPIRGPSRPSLASAAPGTEEFTPEMAKEWRDIRMMVGRNLEPSPQRFAEFVSNARRTKAFGAMSREIAVCFAEMLRLEECNDIPSDRAVKDILELLPSA